MAPNRGANKLNTVLISRYTPDNNPAHWLTPTQVFGDTLNTSLYIDIYGCLLGVDNVDVEKSISVYPNPANSIVNVDFGDLNASSAEIKVYDILGKQVFDNSMKVSSNHYTINLGSESPGIYFVKINVNNKVVVRKISLMR